MTGAKDRSGRIIVVDDDVDMGSLLEDFLSNVGYDVSVFKVPSQALQAVQEEGEAIDLVITDLRMPEMNGIEMIERVLALQPKIPVILVTAFGSVETAVKAIRNGAYDYIVKPFKLGEISIVVDRAVNYRLLQKENRVLRNEVQRNWSLGNIIGKSRSMQQVLDLVKRISRATANVLITGESGTGKEVIARAIHENGPRADKNFVAVNCAAIPEALLESELFGHARGAFTGAIAKKRGLFEEADGGTIFLDEIGDLDLALQAKLLRVIQERTIRPVGETVSRAIDVRIIAATHRDLKDLISQNRFREDLYYRLSVIPIALPPLRERSEDIPLLANYFLAKYASGNGSLAKGFTKAALARLMQMKWEGNVRELENVIERAVVLSTESLIDVEDLPSPELISSETFFQQATADLPTIAELEHRYIKWILDKTGGRKEKASHILGINRRTLYRKEREAGWVHASSEFDSFDEHELPAGMSH